MCAFHQLERGDHRATDIDALSESVLLLNKQPARPLAQNDNMNTAVNQINGRGRFCAPSSPAMDEGHAQRVGEMLLSEWKLDGVPFVEADLLRVHKKVQQQIGGAP